MPLYQVLPCRDLRWQRVSFGLRDFIGICELKIVDSSKYERVVQSVKEATGKASVKVIESYCREALGEYRAQTNRLKSEKKLIPFYPKDGFYIRK